MSPPSFSARAYPKPLNGLAVSNTSMLPWLGMEGPDRPMRRVHVPMTRMAGAAAVPGPLRVTMANQWELCTSIHQRMDTGWQAEKVRLSEQTFPDLNSRR
jgi:hypothetical protein